MDYVDGGLARVLCWSSVTRASGCRGGLHMYLYVVNTQDHTIKALLFIMMLSIVSRSCRVRATLPGTPQR